MIRLGAQYYRPPFPNDRYWKDDMVRMADAGMNTVQLWVKWAWVESAPGQFRFEDYDRLVELAGKSGLGVILSTIAEIHPYWIHREVPDSEMVDNFGRKVVSSNRGECHFGLTPGGCFDHPGVWERMARFLTETANRYKTAPNLVGWDVWNELRWCVNADALVCFCPHTIRRFREWLDKKHGGLDGLNRAWLRRYSCWDDVVPGKLARSPYTETMAFQHFITVRANEHALDRYRTVKSADPAHAVTVHGDSPSVLHGGHYPGGTALHRGNDWAFADSLDGIGCSSFPHWGGMDDADYAARINAVRSAARGKRIWLSEVQGGRASHGFQTHTPVPPADQQRWFWTGVANGAEAVLFWCWRDEVFGCESGGFGIVGADGHAEERVAAMRKTGELIRRHEKLLEGYSPDRPQVGVWFSPQAYYLHWNEEGHGGTAQSALQGYCRALTRQHIPYAVVEEEHLDVLKDIKVLFMPRAIVLDEPTAEALERFVKNGGMLVVESEFGAFASNGVYRYPEDRLLARLVGVREIGRRSLERDYVDLHYAGRELRLPARQWLTPYAGGIGTVLAEWNGSPLALDCPAGRGRVVLLGAYLGDAYYTGSSKKKDPYALLAAGFETFVRDLALSAGVDAPLFEARSAGAGNPFVRVQPGTSGGKPAWFAFAPPGAEVTLRLKHGRLPSKLRENVSGTHIEIRAADGADECRFKMSDLSVALLTPA